jgi:hypothetical protein
MQQIIIKLIWQIYASDYFLIVTTEIMHCYNKIGRALSTASQLVFVVSPECCVLIEEVTNTNIVFGLTRPGLEPTIYRTVFEHANDYAIDAVFIFFLFCLLIRIMKYS